LEAVFVHELHLLLRLVLLDLDVRESHVEIVRAGLRRLGPLILIWILVVLDVVGKLLHQTRELLKLKV
jgi:hypothetical protein